MNNLAVLEQKYQRLSAHLNEYALRICAAADAEALGRGGVSLVAKASGLSRTTIYRGVDELRGAGSAVDRHKDVGRVRRSGGGRKKLAERDPTLSSALERLVDPVTRGDPENPLRWTCKSTTKLTAELQAQGHRISQRSVWNLLDKRGYSMQSTRKTREGGEHPDRDAQFQHIATQVNRFQARNLPVISVDTKKKELIGRFKKEGQEWQKKGEPEHVNVYDFVDKDLGKAIPYGVYDITRNNGWVSVGVTRDTAEFAVQTIRRWWYEMGQAVYPNADALLITADGGGSNGSRVRLWKVMLQQLAEELRMSIHVCHFPPGTSKWNKIEHRMFSYITANWRGRPLESRGVIVNLIANTRTTTGLEIQVDLDDKSYETGLKISDEQMASLRIVRDEFHGEWNYRVEPIHHH